MSPYRATAIGFFEADEDEQQQQQLADNQDELELASLVCARPDIRRARARDRAHMTHDRNPPRPLPPAAPSSCAQWSS